MKIKTRHAVIRGKPPPRIQATLGLVVVLAFPGVIFAQQGHARNGLSVEWLKPSVDETHLENATFYFGYWHRLSDEFMLNFYLPWAIYSPDTDVIEGDRALGNPYLAVSRASPGTSLSYSLGVAFPLTPDDRVAPMIGRISDLTRIGTFLPNRLTLDTAIHWQSMGGRRFDPFAGVGTALVVPTRSEAGETEVFLTFYGGHWQPVGSVRLATGINGHYGVIRGKVPQDRLVLQLLLGVRFHHDVRLPWVTLRLPLTRDYREATRSIMGVGLALPLR